MHVCIFTKETPMKCQNLVASESGHPQLKKVKGDISTHRPLRIGTCIITSNWDASQALASLERTLFQEPEGQIT